MGKPIVSAIIANWNGAEHLRLCLPSLQSQSFGPLEIIVVDNGSHDNSEEVAKAFGIRWLPSRENIGLGPALNLGAAAANGKYLLFVNNDMRFDPDFVAALVHPLNHDDEIFATDGKQYFWDGTGPGHAATRLSRTKSNGGTRVELVPGLYFYLVDEPESTPVFMASAACMLARKAMFEKIGGFDARLPLGYEDAEICLRAWIHGWKTVYVPNAICWHRVGSSSKSTEGGRHNFRGILKGRVLLATKLLPRRYMATTWMVSTAALLRDMALLRWSLAKDRVAILSEYGLLIPQLLREKHKLFRGAGLTPEEHLQRMLQLTQRGEIAALEVHATVGSENRSVSR